MALGTSQQGKCPGCKNTLNHVDAESIRVKLHPHELTGVSYYCPFCFHVVGVGIDPVALQADLVEEIVKALRKG